MLIAIHTDSTSLGGADFYMLQIIAALVDAGADVILFARDTELFRGRVCESVEIAEYGCFEPRMNADERRCGEECEYDQSCTLTHQHTGVQTYGYRRHSRLAPLLLFLGELRQAWRWRRLLRQYKPDVFYSFEGGPEPAVIGACLAGVPRRVVSYCVLPDESKDAPLGVRFMRRLIEFAAARCCTMAITKSISARDAWLRRVKRSESWMHVIYNGLDLNEFPEVSEDRLKLMRQELGIAGRPVIGMTARLHPMKGHEYLLRAMPVILAEVPDVILLLIGDGELMEELKALAESLGVMSSVRFLGFRSDAKELTYLFDVGVLPSVALETFGWAAVEAMACSKPMVVSDFDGLPEVVEDGVTGIVVPPRDSGTLAEALLRLLQDSELRERMGAAGRNRVAEKFTKERMLRQHLELVMSNW